MAEENENRFISSALGILKTSGAHVWIRFWSRDRRLHRQTFQSPLRNFRRFKKLSHSGVHEPNWNSSFSEEH